jgi:hypothetical protein
VVEAGVGCGVGLLGRASVARLDIGRLDLVFGAVTQPDLVDGDGREDLVGMELLGVGWCLHPQQSGGVYVGSEVWSVDASPPPYSTLVVSLALWWPSQWCGRSCPNGGADHQRSRAGRSDSSLA